MTEVTEGEVPGTEPVLAGPLEPKSLNPFETEMWTPLRNPLFSQEKLQHNPVKEVIQLPELINKDT